MAINIEDSSAVELFRDQGAVRALRNLLLDLGEARFGAPDSNTRATTGSLADQNRLKKLALRIQSVSNWQELLNTP